MDEVNEKLRSIVVVVGNNQISIRLWSIRESDLLMEFDARSAEAIAAASVYSVRVSHWNTSTDAPMVDL